MEIKEEKKIAQKMYYWRKKGFVFSSINEIEEHKANLKQIRKENRLAKNREKTRQKREEMKVALEYYKKNVLQEM